ARGSCQKQKHARNLESKLHDETMLLAFFPRRPIFSGVGNAPHRMRPAWVRQSSPLRFSVYSSRSLLQGGELQQWVNFFEDRRHFPREAAGCRGYRFQLAPYNPSLQLFPLFQRPRPPFLLAPFFFLGHIPIAFVFPGKPRFLLAQPFLIAFDARLRNLADRRFLTLPTAINPEADRSRLRRKADVQLTGITFTRKRCRKFQIHLRTVRRLVFRKANVAIDPRKRRSCPQLGVQSHHRRSEFLQQTAE